MRNNILVTGGAGFIGSAFIRFAIASCNKIVNLDLLTYAANLENLGPVKDDERYVFVKGDIRDEKLVEKLCIEHEIDTIVHFAAESHVDRSIFGPKAFFETNVGGTLSLLEVVRRHPSIHFHHVSTDEVFGSLGKEGYFTERSPYLPNSPYSASKAASDHFVRAYAKTYGLKHTLSYCSNNFGPCQYAEKFIPLMISHCLQRKSLPVYGNGENIRDWLYVDDHVEAIWTILEKGKVNESYAIAGCNEKRNIDLLHDIIARIANIKGEDIEELRSLITFMPDRPGHDFRYAIDCSKIKELNWKPRHDFSSALQKTIEWYIERSVSHV